MPSPSNAPRREPGTLYPDPYVALMVSGYFAQLPHYRLDDVWRQQADMQHYAAVSYADRPALDPNDTRIMHVRITDAGAVFLTEVIWIDGTKRYEPMDAIRDAAYAAKVLQEQRNAEERVLDEQEARLGELVVRDVIPMRRAR